jgi:hypothetical protein
MKLPPLHYLYPSEKISNILLGLLPHHFTLLRSRLPTLSLLQHLQAFNFLVLLSSLSIPPILGSSHLLVLLLLYVDKFLRVVSYPSLGTNIHRPSLWVLSLTTYLPRPLFYMEHYQEPNVGSQFIFFNCSKKSCLHPLSYKRQIIVALCN